MSSYVVSTGDDLQVMPLCNMLADTEPDTIVAEVVGDEDTDDPLVALRDSLASPHDFFWPLNMFWGAQLRLSELRRFRRVMREGNS